MTQTKYSILALICIDNATLLFLCEFLEIFTLHVMYVTAVLYLRHLVPRKLTACGQALPVIAHFCIGKSWEADGKFPSPNWAIL